jgi:hypothetical protein
LILPHLLVGVYLCYYPCVVVIVNCSYHHDPVISMGSYWLC